MDSSVVKGVLAFLSSAVVVALILAQWTAYQAAVGTKDLIDGKCAVVEKAAFDEIEKRLRAAIEKEYEEKYAPKEKDGTD